MTSVNYLYWVIFELKVSFIVGKLVVVVHMYTYVLFFCFISSILCLTLIFYWLCFDPFQFKTHHAILFLKTFNFSSLCAFSRLMVTVKL